MGTTSIPRANHRQMIPSLGRPGSISDLKISSGKHTYIQGKQQRLELVFFLDFLRHPDLFLHMVECRPTGTFLSIIPSQSAMNLSQDEDLSTRLPFKIFCASWA